MCNLYKLSQSADEVAQLFNPQSVASGNAGEEVYPGYPGLVFDGEALRTMTWGFPLALRGKSGQMLKPKPVNNTRTDKLDSGFWRASFRDRRCLIPLTAFAEAEGPKGNKTRTWFSIPDQPIFTAAGIWRDSAEWGAVYSMVMTDAAKAVEGVHDRSPVLLEPRNWDRWLTGSQAEALTLCTPYPGAMSVDRTSEPWVRR
ncbi:SOS response-associated peptidase [Croceicoccus bisphenolivorans]|uniref:SOS response-associated peptidase n=1 Tax=Croceicoccus bisphenolivorans TaxID=1783232 RepID=UPI00082EEFCD|nr:SOS response-associated peptidase family protein [Croceicoccus bisphenolivorans]